MKWNVIEPSRGARDFRPGDAIAGFAASQGMRVKGHTFLWHGATPSSVNALPADELRVAVDQHIRAVADHYRGRIHAWDVVNEAIADGGGSAPNPPGPPPGPPPPGPPRPPPGPPRPGAPVR